MCCRTVLLLSFVSFRFRSLTSVLRASLTEMCECRELNGAYTGRFLAAVALWAATGPQIEQLVS